MGVAFEQGKYPIMISGSWWYGRFKDEIKNFDWGTFLFPGNKLHPGSSGNLWVVPEKSQAKSLAYDFIDITMQPGDPEPARQLRRHPGRGRPRRRSPTRRTRS